MLRSPTPEPVFLTTTQISHLHERDACATGFYLNVDDTTYLITNAHAIVKDYSLSDDRKLYRQISTNPPKLNYRTRKETDVLKTERQTIDLSDNSVRWAFYPGSADIVAIEVPQSLPSIEEKYEDPSLNSSLAITKEYTLHSKKLTGESAFVLGYPGDIYDHENKLPVRRHALIASAFEVGYEGEPKFLTDARMDPGTSGSPVFISAENVILEHGAHPRNRHNIPYLAGVHSGNYYLSEGGEGMTNRKYSDLNETWYYHCPFGAIKWLNQMESNADRSC